MERNQGISEKQIDQAVAATFPASDPVALHSTGAEVDPKTHRADGACCGGAQKEGGVKGWWRRLTGGRSSAGSSGGHAG